MLLAIMDIPLRIRSHLAAGASSIGATTFTRPSSIVTSMPKPAEFAAGQHLYVAKATWIHVARMRIEPGEHAIDCRLDEFVRLFDVGGSHPLEYFAEQVELLVGVRERCFGARSDADGAWLRHQESEAGTGNCPKKMRDVLRIICKPFRPRCGPSPAAIF